jgi:hypothetical protein
MSPITLNARRPCRDSPRHRVQPDAGNTCALGRLRAGASINLSAATASEPHTSPATIPGSTSVIPNGDLPRVGLEHPWWHLISRARLPPLGRSLFAETRLVSREGVGDTRKPDPPALPKGRPPAKASSLLRDGSSRQPSWPERPSLGRAAGALRGAARPLLRHTDQAPERRFSASAAIPSE